MEDDHPCPRCSQPTPGAWNESGLLWVICEDCRIRDAEDREMEARVERERELGWWP